MSADKEIDWLKNNGIALGIWLSVSIGILLRLRQYLIGRSLWFDESLLAMNIVTRSYAELLEPLDHFQGAPILFLWVENLLSNLMGSGEYILRLFPLLAGIAALALFPLLAGSYLAPRAVLWGTILYAFNDPLIYYASEVKQYSVDVLAATLALFLFLRLMPGKATWPAAIGLGTAGAILIWLSHPAIFTLTSSALIILYLRMKDGNREQLLIAVLVGAIWFLSFLAFTVLSLDQLGQNEVLLNFWRSGFPPLSGGIQAGIVWFRLRFLDVFANTFDLAFPLAALASYLVGAAVLLRRKPPLALSLVLPLVLVILAAVLQKYPFYSRLILFLCPLLFIVLAQGLDSVLYWLEGTHVLRAAAVLLILVFLAPQIANGLSYVNEPEYGEHIRPVIEYVYENRLPDDPIYLYYASVVPFAYYQPRYPIPDEYAIAGSRAPHDAQAYRRELEQIVPRSGRLWFVASHATVGAGAGDEQIILDILEDLGGRQQAAFQETKASAYLYYFAQ